MKATVNWKQGMSFDCISDSNNSVLMDGEGKAVTPMEAVLMAVGACSSIDVVEILQKARQNISACRCELDAKRADDAPRVFTHIRATYHIKGTDISEKHLARAVQLSTEKYCSVMLMLNGKVPIECDYIIES